MATRMYRHSVTPFLLEKGRPNVDNLELSRLVWDNAKHSAVQACFVLRIMRMGIN